MRWQSEEAGQRLSEILRAAESEPQIITGHGADVAVVIGIAEYRTLRGEAPSLAEHLRAGPFIDYDLDALINRSKELPREFDLTD
jgi:prevent-host-death family protein